MVQEGVEQGEQQQGQLGQQGHPVVEVVLFADHRGAVAQFCRVEASLEILQPRGNEKLDYYCQINQHTNTISTYHGK